MEPEDAGNYLQLGELYSEMGNQDEAADSYRKAIDLRGDYSELHLLLAGVYRKMGRLNDAEMEERAAREVTCALHPGLE
jgi:cytochrome c-type biogenesis protein CcmH/NrfG